MWESDAFKLEPGAKSMISDFTDLHNVIDSADYPYHTNLTDDYFQPSITAPTVDFERDTVLVRNPDGNLIAFGIIISRNNPISESRLTIQVHPEYRRQGIGSRILQHLTEVGIERGSSEFVFRVPSFRPYVIAFAKNHGFTYDYSWTKMEIEHKTPVSTPSLPWGLTVRGLNVKKELPVLANLQNVIFKDNPHYETVDVKTLLRKTNHNSFDPNLLILCTVSDKPVGYGFGYSVLSETSEKLLRIDNMGVHPDYRRHRYGQALVFELLNRAYIKKHTSSEITVLSSNKPALRLFEKCGFKERYKYLLYRRSYEQ
jgi:ribosomal protein S18 acetylase RimI-like enzyme